MTIHRLLLLAALALTSACGDRYEDIGFQRIAGADDAKLDGRGITVPVGRVVAFTVDADTIGGRRDYDVTDTVVLRSTNPLVARIEAGVRVDTWMILGAALGDATMEIRINGELVDHIPILIEPQAPIGGQ